MQDQPTNVQPTEPPKRTGSYFGRIGAILLLVAGIAGGALGGFAIAFGSCFKSSCSPVENYAPFWIPLATLAFTIPLVVRAFRKR